MMMMKKKKKKKKKMMMMITIKRMKKHELKLGHERALGSSDLVPIAITI